MEKFSYQSAFELLKKYNKEEFHLEHGTIVGKVLREFALNLGFENQADFWELVGLLHDIDYEMYPELHCIKAPELLAEIGASDDFIHAVCSHCYGMGVEIEPVHPMEKVLFAVDELTGLIGAAARMRPNGISDMELSSLKKKFKDKKFAQGCSRDIIKKGADFMGVELDSLLGDTLEAMKKIALSDNN